VTVGEFRSTWHLCSPYLRPGMHLQRIKLTNFKNYAQQSLALSPRLNCFTGLNGMGKTNVLDAVHFLCLCKSHSGLPDRNLVRHGESFLRLEGWFEQAGEQARVVGKFAVGQRKEVERNGTPYPRLTDYIGQFPVVMIAPDDVSLVQDGSEERRRFLDTTLSQISPGYLHNLVVYNHLIRQRNALLKTFAEERRFDPTLLEGIDRQLPAPAQALFARRRAFVEDFRPLLQTAYATLSGGHETVEANYQSDLAGGDFAGILPAVLEKDRLLQRSTRGPHRDDLVLFMDGHPVKKFASQGQLKSFLLALRLAQYEVLRNEKGVAPLLLLDDIFDKLDEHRVRHLIGLLLGRDFGQIFITDTQRGRIEAIVASFTGEYQIFEVVNGEIQ